MTAPATHIPTPATDDVIRMVGATQARLEFRAPMGDEGGPTTDGAAADGRLMVGYAAVFGVWEEIHSWWEGDFVESLDPGCFDGTLAKRGDRVKVQFDHGFDPSIGGKPLGKPSTMTPDDTGLWTETPLSRTTYNEDLLELIRDGALDGMSFRFRVTEERWVEDPPPSDYNPKGLAERTILRVDLFEFGPVTFPAYEATTLGVRSADVYRAWRVDPTIFSAAAGDSTDSHPRPDSRTDPDGDTSPVTTRAQRQVLLRRALPKLKELTR